MGTGAPADRAGMGGGPAGAAAGGPLVLAGIGGPAGLFGMGGGPLGRLEAAGAGTPARCGRGGGAPPKPQSESVESILGGGGGGPLGHTGSSAISS